MIKDYSLCWHVVFTRNIFPCDSLGVNFNCKIFEMKPPLCSAEYVVKPQCIGYSEKCFKHPTTSQPFLCKFFAPLMSYDGILKWIVRLLSAMQILNPGEWNTVHSGIGTHFPHFLHIQASIYFMLFTANCFVDTKKT